MKTETKKTNISTRELWMKLFQAGGIDEFLSGNGESAVLPSFSEYIRELAATREEKPEQVLRRAGIEKSFGHRLFSGTRKPSRDTVLQLAFGFELTPDETQQLLKISRAAALHPKIKRDAVIAFCLNRKFGLAQAQLALEDAGLPLLGGKRNLS